MLTFHRRKLSFNITNGTVKYCTEKKFKTDLFLNTVVTTQFRPVVLIESTSPTAPPISLLLTPPLSSLMPPSIVFASTAHEPPLPTTSNSSPLPTTTLSLYPSSPPSAPLPGPPTSPRGSLPLPYLPRSSGPPGPAPPQPADSPPRPTSSGWCSSSPPRSLTIATPSPPPPKSGSSRLGWPFSARWTQTGTPCTWTHYSHATQNLDHASTRILTPLAIISSLSFLTTCCSLLIRPPRLPPSLPLLLNILVK